MSVPQIMWYNNDFCSSHIAWGVVSTQTDLKYMVMCKHRHFIHRM
jgi:hypothetical protein